MTKPAKPFWETKTLDQMTDREWELLCDGCGLCCLHKFEDEETQALEFTCVKCQHLDSQRQCQVYSNRTEQVPDCLNIRDIPTDHYRWLPESCAYRRLNAGQPLPNWHPLLTGSSDAMEQGGHGVGDWAISDKGIDVTEDFIIKIASINPEN